jgi:hypothetical protein
MGQPDGVNQNPNFTATRECALGGADILAVAAPTFPRALRVLAALTFRAARQRGRPRLFQ